MNIYTMKIFKKREVFGIQIMPYLIANRWALPLDIDIGYKSFQVHCLCFFIQVGWWDKKKNLIDKHLEWRKRMESGRKEGT